MPDRDLVERLEVTVLDRTRDATDVAHDAGRFSRLGLTSETILAKLAGAATEVAGWGAGNEAATMRFAMAEIIRLRARQPENAGGEG